MNVLRGDYRHLGGAAGHADICHAASPALHSCSNCSSPLNPLAEMLNFKRSNSRYSAVPSAGVVALPIVAARRHIRQSVMEFIAIFCTYNPLIPNQKTT